MLLEVAIAIGLGVLVGIAGLFLGFEEKRARLKLEKDYKNLQRQYIQLCKDFITTSKDLSKERTEHKKSIQEHLQSLENHADDLEKFRKRQNNIVGDN